MLTRTDELEARGGAVAPPGDRDDIPGTDGAEARRLPVEADAARPVERDREQRPVELTQDDPVRRDRLDDPDRTRMRRALRHDEIPGRGRRACPAETRRRAGAAGPSRRVVAAVAVAVALAPRRRSVRDGAGAAPGPARRCRLRGGGGLRPLPLPALARAAVGEGCRPATSTSAAAATSGASRALLEGESSPSSSLVVITGACAHGKRTVNGGRGGVARRARAAPSTFLQRENTAKTVG